MIEELDSLTIEQFLDNVLDTPTRERLAQLYPPFAVGMLHIYFHMYNIYGMKMRCVEGLRTYARQSELYAQGRTKPGRIVTNVKEGQSLHNFGLAVDSCFAGNDPYLAKTFNSGVLWSAFGKFAKMEELIWGGDIVSLNDKTHVEIAHGLSLGDLQSLMAQGGVDLIYKQLGPLQEPNIILN